VRHAALRDNAAISGYNPAGGVRTVPLRHPQRARPAAGGHSCRCARAIASDGSPSIQDPIPRSGGKLPRAAGAPGCSWSICVETSTARESCSSVDVACRFGCCALLVRARPSLAASTSNAGRGVCPAGFLPLEVVAAVDRAPSYPRPAHPVHVRSPAKECAQLRQRVSDPGHRVTMRPIRSHPSPWPLRGRRVHRGVVSALWSGHSGYDHRAGWCQQF
jgi:hypothetical protein